MASFKFLISFLLIWLSSHVAGLQLTPGDKNSVREACHTIIENIMTVYTGNKPGGTPGILPKPYYWWQAGALWGQLIEYWAATGDDKYNQLVQDAMLFQIGDDRNYQPANVTQQLGNDDQVFWAFSAMTAAELKFKDPPKEYPSWIALAQAVFNKQVGRWDTDSCAGGLRWQVFFSNAGYDYKNTISNGGLFQLAARLARYTGNQTYVDWANKAYDWVASTPNLEADFTVNDGSDVKLNCTDANHDQWTYNYGVFLMGAVYMYDASSGAEQAKWKARIDGFLPKIYQKFFPTKHLNQPSSANIMVEIKCEEPKNCNYDQTSFKSYLIRWMAVTSQLAPWTTDAIKPKLTGSAVGAAQQCSGDAGGSWCGQNWNSATWDGFKGVGEQMSALAAIQSTLAGNMQKPLTAKNGGTSEADPNAGSGKGAKQLGRITSADKGGAGFLTFLIMAGTTALGWWMVGGDWRER